MPNLSLTLQKFMMKNKVDDRPTSQQAKNMIGQTIGF